MSVIINHQGEEYKLFWPDSPEFVRLAAQFDVKIVPFGVVGEDDIGQVWMIRLLITILIPWENDV